MIKDLTTLSAVVFDLDGLLFDTERVSCRALAKALVSMGVPPADDLYPKMIGRNLRNAARQLLAAFGDDFDAERALELLTVYFNEDVEANGIPQKPGILELLDTIESKRLKKAVASSSPRKYVEHKLTHANILSRFQAIVCGDEISHGKPAPDIFLKAAELLQVDPARCLVLEDSVAGVKGGHAAGMPVIMVPDMVAPTEETHSLVYQTCTSLHEVNILLKNVS